MWGGVCLEALAEVQDRTGKLEPLEEELKLWWSPRMGWDFCTKTWLAPDWGGGLRVGWGRDAYLSPFFVLHSLPSTGRQHTAP